MTIIAPSILSANFGRLEQEIKAVEAAGADWIHVDIMDGQFVPPITFGPIAVEAARRATSLPLDVHLMIIEPEKQIDAVAQAGADRITVHAEACPHLHRAIQRIRELGKKPGVAINPATPLEAIREVIPDIDLLLVMTINPGWAGQPLIPHTLKKLESAASMIKASGRKIELEVDGGINGAQIKDVVQAGATVAVAGSYIFSNPDYKAAIANLRGSS